MKIKQYIYLLGGICGGIESITLIVFTDPS